MRIIEVTKPFSMDRVNFLAGHKYIMADDIEGNYRATHGDKLSMSYPYETIHKPYKGQDLNGKRLLVFRTGGLGDMLFLCPALRYIKKKYPNCFLRVASGCKQPLENVPEINELYDMPFDAKLLEDIDYVAYFQGIIEGEKEEAKKTHAVDLFYSYFGIDSTHFPVEDKRPKLFFKKEEMDWLKQMLIKLGIAETDYVIGIQMETSSPLRNFPKEKFKPIIDILAKEENVKIVLIGTEQHEVLSNYYKGANKNVIAAIKNNVRESIILANRYDLIISPDSFMIQVAGAMEKPLIGLYGPFPSEVRMKYFKNAIGLDCDVVCSPCCKHDFRGCVKGNPSPCFTQITVDDILQAVDFMKHTFTKSHFSFMQPLLKQPDISEIEKYLLTADKGLCFFGGFFEHSNIIRVDSNVYTRPEVTNMNTEFKRNAFPFVLYMGPIGFNPKNRPYYDGSKQLVRPGGHYIVHLNFGGSEPFFEEVKKDLGSKFILLHSKFDPALKSFTVIAQRPI